MNRLTVTLPKFEGPLDLLLYLIRKEEMDIFDIKIHEITRQYLEYIKRMRELDLEVAGEFVAMASTLIHIKSRMLLPQYNDQGEIVENEDPRKELVQRLLEYQKYQEAAKALNERPLVGRDIWLRGTREVIKPPEEEIVLEENALFALISSYRKALKSFQKKIHRVAKKAQSIAQRILELKDRLIPGQRITMRELLTITEDRTRQILITFLSLLELGKMGYVTLYQSETYGDIYVDPKKDISSDVISRVEEFDGLKTDEASQAAERLFHEAEEAAQLQAELPLSEDLELTDLGEDNLSLGAEEMASDEEILAAEKELETEPELKAEIELDAETDLKLTDQNFPLKTEKQDVDDKPLETFVVAEASEELLENPSDIELAELSEVDTDIELVEILEAASEAASEIELAEGSDLPAPIENKENIFMSEVIEAQISDEMENSQSLVSIDGIDSNEESLQEQQIEDGERA